MQQYRPSTNSSSIPGNSLSPSAGGSFPQSSLLGSFISKMPYAYQIIDAMIARNPKFEDFKGVTPKREELIYDRSVFIQDQNNNSTAQNPFGAPGNITINKDYQAFVYASIDRDKTRRLLDYRRMAAYAEVADCLDEICDECIVKDSNDDITQFTLRGSYSKEIKDRICREYKRFVNIFDLEDIGWEYFRQFLVDGEIFLENVIDQNHKEYGVIGVVSIPSELINPVYSNVQNELIKGFILRKPVMDAAANTLAQGQQEEMFFMQKSQLTYVHSGIWNEHKTIRLPYIENAKRAYRQLSLIEDSVVIYRLVRAPERLMFSIYTGNMPAPKAEAHVKRIMQQYWSKKNYDGQLGKVTNVYDPSSMMDSYFFPKDQQGNGSSVSVLPSGGALGEIKDLDYFLAKLYKSLKLPASRMSAADSPYKDGAEINRDELRFARFVIRLQRQFATSIRDTFITHLKLKDLWNEYKIREADINVEFNVPTSFMAVRDQQLLELKFKNFSEATNNQNIAPSFAMKYYLEWSSDQMKENREWLKRDKAFAWELSQIEASGPNFRAQAAGEAGGEMGTSNMPELGGGGGGGGGSSSAETPPAFGSAETPEAPATPAESPATATETPTPAPV